ncbi:hypothetical protein RP20_CCG014245 [Aedes albopictus]|nr:hypothetical protein RP20_CCG014245 [Aedes albopictus]
MPSVRYRETIGMVSHSDAKPRSYEEAMASPESVFWKTAMNEEFRSLMENGAWKIFTLPAGRKKVGCKWMFKRKEDQTSNVVRYKARLGLFPKIRMRL